MLAGVVFVYMHHATSANKCQQLPTLLRPTMLWLVASVCMGLKGGKGLQGSLFWSKSAISFMFCVVNKHLKRNLLAHLLTWSVAIVTTSHFEPENVFLQETYFLTIYSIDLNHTNSSYYKEIEAYSELGLLWSFKYLKSYSYFTSFSSQNIG